MNRNRLIGPRARRFRFLSVSVADGGMPHYRERGFLNLLAMGNSPGVLQALFNSVFVPSLVARSVTPSLFFSGA
jgi:hypothetical protein